MTLIMNQFGQLIGSTNPMLYIAPHYHFVMGSFAFGMIFMATDPVSSAHTKKRNVVLWEFYWSNVRNNKSNKSSLS